MIRIDKLGNRGNSGTPKTIFPSNWPNPLPDGTSQVPVYNGNNQNIYQDEWEESISLSIDPADDLTFWGTGEWLPSGGQGSCCDWNTQIFLCRKGNPTPSLCP
jgi:hypothetical protein